METVQGTWAYYETSDEQPLRAVLDWGKQSYHLVSRMAIKYSPVRDESFRAEPG